MVKVTLEDIAKKVGVSKTTASFVLNGMGKQAVEMLLRRFKQPDKEIQKLIMTAELIEEIRYNLN